MVQLPEELWAHILGWGGPLSLVRGEHARHAAASRIQRRERQTRRPAWESGTPVKVFHRQQWFQGILLQVQPDLWVVSQIGLRTPRKRYVFVHRQPMRTLTSCEPFWRSHTLRSLPDAWRGPSCARSASASASSSS